MIKMKLRESAYDNINPVKISLKYPFTDGKYTHIEFKSEGDALDFIHDAELLRKDYKSYYSSRGWIVLVVTNKKLLKLN